MKTKDRTKKKKFGRFREKEKVADSESFFFLLQSKPAGCEPLFILLSNIDSDRRFVPFKSRHTHFAAALLPVMGTQTLQH